MMSGTEGDRKRGKRDKKVLKSKKYGKGTRLC
jgi:hypothetical protein